MIKFTGTENEKSSSFYRRNELIAHEWETLAAEMGSDASGEYNSYLVDIHLNVPNEVSNFDIHGKHQLSSITSDLLPPDSQYAGETSIRTYLNGEHPGSFFIRRANLMNVLTSDDKPYPHNKDFLYNADDEALFKTILEDHPYSSQLWSMSLVSFKYSQKDGELLLLVGQLLQDQEEIKDLVAFFKHTAMLISQLS